MTLAILIEPLDLLFCRDGRPIVAGEGAAAGTALPNPQVLTGAIRTALLRRRGQLQDNGRAPEARHIEAVKAVRVRGPLLADLRTGRPFIPMPADVVGQKAKHGQQGSASTRLIPRERVPGWQAPPDAPQALAMWAPPDKAREQQPKSERHRVGELAPQSGFLTWEGFEVWAKGGIPAADHIRIAKDLWIEEVRTNVALTPDGAVADEGLLFTTRYLRLRQGIGLYAEIDGPASDLPDTIQLGGDRRQARITRLKGPVAWPKEGRVALALTPVILPQGRCPEAWRDHCTGLAVPGADPVSGWDLAAHHGAGSPRPTRWAIRAGSVWHLSQSFHDTMIGLEIESGFGWIARGQPPSLT